MAGGVWQQVELKLAPGAELWYIARHRRGWFRVPGFAPVNELWSGVHDGWNDKTARHTPHAATVRVPMSDWAALVAFARAHEGELAGFDPELVGYLLK